MDTLPEIRDYALRAVLYSTLQQLEVTSKKLEVESSENGQILSKF